MWKPLLLWPPGGISITSPSWVVLSSRMTLLSRGNGGNMYIDLPCQSCDRASIASARGFGTGDKLGCCGLWQTCPLLEFPMSRRFGSLFWVETPLLLWVGSAKSTGPLSHLSSPECVWPRGLYFDFVAIGTDPLPDVTRCGWRLP